MRDLVDQFKTNAACILGVSGDPRYDNHTDGIPHRKIRLYFETATMERPQSWQQRQDAAKRRVQDAAKRRVRVVFRQEPSIPPKCRDKAEQPDNPPDFLDSVLEHRPAETVKPKPIKYTATSAWERILFRQMIKPHMYVVFTNPVAGAIMVGCKEPEAKEIFKRWSSAGIMHQVMQPKNACRHGWITPDGKVTPMEFKENDDAYL